MKAGEGEAFFSNLLKFRCERETSAHSCKNGNSLVADATNPANVWENSQGNCGAFGKFKGKFKET